MFSRMIITIVVLSTAMQLYSKPIEVEFFFKVGCAECDKVKNDILPKLKEQFCEQIIIINKDLSSIENTLTLSAYQEANGYLKNAPVFLVINHTSLLGGITDIRNRSCKEIAQAISSSSSNNSLSKKNRHELLQRRVKRFSFTTIAIAGLLDGINPCVFAGLVFFMSLLISLKLPRKQLILTGFSYCLGCFCTYLALGFGILNLLYWSYGFKCVRFVFNSIIFLVILVLAIFSFIDAFLFSKNPTSSSVKVQLPNVFKKKIHTLMKKATRKKVGLSLGIFILGIVVTVIESVCTGQLYIPILVYLTRANILGVHLLYLLLYNFMFIVPLILILIFVLYGIRVPQLIKINQFGVKWGKFALGIFYLLLAICFYILD